MFNKLSLIEIFLLYRVSHKLVKTLKIRKKERKYDKEVLFVINNIYIYINLNCHLKRALISQNIRNRTTVRPSHLLMQYKMFNLTSRTFYDTTKVTNNAYYNSMQHVGMNCRKLQGRWNLWIWPILNGMNSTQIISNRPTTRSWLEWGRAIVVDIRYCNFDWSICFQQGTQWEPFYWMGIVWRCTVLHKVYYR